LPVSGAVALGSVGGGQLALVFRSSGENSEADIGLSLFRVVASSAVFASSAMLLLRKFSFCEENFPFVRNFPFARKFCFAS